MAWSPKKTARAQAVRLRVMRSAGASSRAAVRSAGPAPRSRTSGAHGTTATAASTAQTVSPDCQLPPSASVTGTVTAAAAEVPRARAIE